MNKLLSLLALLFIIVPAFSQPTETNTAQALDNAGERHRIQAGRAREVVHYGQEEAACYARFAVTDCLGQVRVRRRAALDHLRRQEILLNDAERKRKALEQIERIKEKSSTQRVKPEPKITTPEAPV